MQLATIRVGDIVACEVRGQRFYARVGTATDRRSGTIAVAPLIEGGHLPAYHVKARQVVGHFRRSKASRV